MNTHTHTHTHRARLHTEIELFQAHSGVWAATVAHTWSLSSADGSWCPKNSTRTWSRSRPGPVRVRVRPVSDSAAVCCHVRSEGLRILRWYANGVKRRMLSTALCWYRVGIATAFDIQGPEWKHGFMSESLLRDDLTITITHRHTHLLQNSTSYTLFWNDPSDVTPPVLCAPCFKWVVVHLCQRKYRASREPKSFSLSVTI